MTISNLDKERKRRGQRGKAEGKAGSKRAKERGSEGAETLKAKNAEKAGVGTESGDGVGGEPEKEKKKRGRPPKKERAATEDKTGADLKDHKGARKALRHAVKAAVKEQKTKIAKTLVDKAMEGNTRSAEMMLELMHKKKKDGEGGKKKKQKGASWAQLLALEDEYDKSAEGDEKKAEGG
jgi:hypothetical protein